MADKSAVLRGSGMDCVGNLIQDGFVRPIDVNGERYGSLVDVMAIFAPEGNIPRVYWNQQKKRLLGKDDELYQSLIQLPLLAEDGKKRKTDVAPLWACVFIVLLMDTPMATEFKKRLAKFTASEIKYRMGNVARGSEWAADTNHNQLVDGGATMAFTGHDPELNWWQH